MAWIAVAPAISAAFEASLDWLAALASFKAVLLPTKFAAAGHFARAGLLFYSTCHP